MSKNRPLGTGEEPSQLQGEKTTMVAVEPDSELLKEPFVRRKRPDGIYETFIYYSHALNDRNRRDEIGNLILKFDDLPDDCKGRPDA
jgi:hypothetical protein